MITTQGDNTVLMFESLRSMLLGFANEPVTPDYSDPRYVPIRLSKSGDGFNITFTGRPDNYEAWIHPHRFHSNTGYMGLRIQKNDDVIRCLTFRVAAYNAGMTYEFKFNFDEGQPELELRQGRGANITGERVAFQKVQCIDLVVLDLVELMLPPQFLAYNPEIYRGTWGFVDKPCILCGASIRNNWYVCGDCHPYKVTVTA